MKAVYEEAANLQTKGHKFVLATVVNTKGSTPQKPGATLLVREDGSTVGTLGGGCVEGDIWFAAKEALSKALGTGIRKGVNFKDIEILNDIFGKPSILLKGSTENFLKKQIKKKKYFIYLSLSDDLPWAQATVIISYK